MKYRKKSVVIEAVRNDGTWAPIRDWLVMLAGGGFAFQPGTSPPITRNSDGVLSIRTAEGTMAGNVGDWIIRGVKGELYPCKPDIFALTYESADVPAPTTVESAAVALAEKLSRWAEQDEANDDQPDVDLTELLFEELDAYRAARDANKKGS